MTKTILVTGGAGYIGSHTCVELANAGYDLVVVDNLCNSSEVALRRVERIIGKPIRFYEADLRDRGALDRVFGENDIHAVVHFAGLKAVGESVEKPLEYYGNNIGSTLALLGAMRAHGVKSLVFSSSATVYGEPAFVPITEECPKGKVTNPYGWTKWMIEQVLEDLAASDPEWNIVLLRYFNPIGAHESGLIGEDPKGIPNNLVPYITQVACGRLARLNVYGGDYDTPDGTGVRDYIHVVDLARGHMAALEWMEGRAGCEVFNLGTGEGYSVLQMVGAFEEVVGREIPYEVAPRRSGDVATCYSDPAKARRVLGWRAERSLQQMCEDAWRWQERNPDGYRGGEEGARAR